MQSTSGIPTKVLSAFAQQLDHDDQVSLFNQTPPSAHTYHQSACTLLAKPSVTSLVYVAYASSVPHNPQIAAAESTASSPQATLDANLSPLAGSSTLPCLVPAAPPQLSRQRSVLPGI